MVKPSSKALGKRKAPHFETSKPSNKKPKSATIVERGPTGKPKRKPDQPRKVKLRDQKVIPVPKTAFARDSDADTEEDMDDLGEDEGMAVDMDGVGFLTQLDGTALSRSTKETKRLHELAKAREPLPQPGRRKSGLRILDVASGSDDASVSDLDFDSDDEGEAEGSGSRGMSSDVDDASLSVDEEDLNVQYDEEAEDSEEEEEAELAIRERRKWKKDTQEEAEYEHAGRVRWAPAAVKPEEDSVEVGRLPIKLPTGEVQRREGKTRIALPPTKKAPPEPETESEEEEEEGEEDEGSDDGQQAERIAGQKGRFGRLGVAEIMGKEGWRNAQRLDAAKEQMASIGAEILAGGELIDIGPVLTRLSTFALSTVPALENGEPLAVPASIRGLAFLSQLAVYKDLVPGYRIRDLTAAEEAEKVRDEVRRLREGEKLLVRSYKGYLKLLEAEVKVRSALASLALRCMCDLLSAVPHFNFSENIMGVLVARVGRKSWDDDSDLVLRTFVDVFRHDITAVQSQSLVRLIARMIKERKFQVHPNVLSCLLHLRLRSELDQMKDSKSKHKGRRDGVKMKYKSKEREKWATKNQKKRERELKEVQKEMAEAEAEVDKDERATTQTETLKNLFVLYFSILKSPIRSPLLAAALEGISHFAHLINVDFFRDLLAVLRQIIIDQQAESTDAEQDQHASAAEDQSVRIRLLAIVTAFDLLSGQGEALNIDLGDFANCLFVLLRPLALDTSLEDPPVISTRLAAFAKPAKPDQPGRSPKQAVATLSTSALLFRCLNAIFFSRHASNSSIWRSSAFVKRLVECALLFPPSTARQAIAFVRGLIARDAKLEGLLDTEERMFDGVYKPEMEDPQLANAFATSLYEVNTLATRHWDKGVREEAMKLRDGTVLLA